MNHFTTKDVPTHGLLGIIFYLMNETYNTFGLLYSSIYATRPAIPSCDRSTTLAASSTFSCVAAGNCKYLHF